jgi:hypothetical protein
MLPKPAPQHVGAPGQHLTNLRRLHIRSTQVRDLRPLAGLPKLKLNDARADDEP